MNQPRSHAPGSTGVSIGVVIAAAGSGNRFAAGNVGAAESIPKQWLPLRGVPLIAYSFRFFDRWDVVSQIAVALDASSATRPERLAFVESQFGKKVYVAVGGASRQESVWAALRRFDPIPDIAMVHDAARPFPPLDAIERAIGVAREKGGAILAGRLVETVKKVNDRMEIVETLDRSCLWRAQTPQIFRGAELVRAYRSQERRLSEFTDDASIFESAGGTVCVVESPESNFKVTLPEDFVRAERLLAARDKK